MTSLAYKFEGLYHITLKDNHKNLFRINNSYVCTLPDGLLSHLSLTRMQSIYYIFPFAVVV